MKAISRILLLILISLFLLTFVSTASAVIYGDDDRIEPYAALVELQNIATNSTAALIDAADVDVSNPDHVSIIAEDIQVLYDLCEDERFLSQPSAAFCSGVLIDDDLLLTAGQCIRTHEDCESTRIVFNYRMQDSTTLNNITSDDVFNCQEIVASRFTETIDYAIIRLDRPATPRFTPATVRVEAEAVPEGTELVVIGHPTGLPTKIEPGGWVRDNRQDDLDYFVSNSDTFAGNSGSGVWRMDTDEIIGILVRGETDFVDTGSCYRSNVCEDTGCSGEESTYVFHATEDLCLLQQSPLICGAPTCDDALPITPTGTQVVSGDTGQSDNNATPGCVTTSTAPDDLYVFTLEAQTLVTASVTGFDTVLYLRSTCYDSTSELACNDDTDPPNSISSFISVILDSGVYFLIVDGFENSSGPYNLTIDFENLGCSVDSDCDDGLFCNGPETCIDSVCSSGSPPCSGNSICLEDSDTCDNCPDDPDKIEPGICGCGFSDIDSDTDNIADCADNCPYDYNPGQEDLDEDTIGDVCDDEDNDGFTSDEDCDDQDSSINPDACDIKRDGIDQDCDGVDRTKGKPCVSDDGGEPSSKEGPAQTCSDFLDNDGDGDVDCADSDCVKKKHCKNPL